MNETSDKFYDKNCFNQCNGHSALFEPKIGLFLHISNCPYHTSMTSVPPPPVEPHPENPNNYNPLFCL